METEPVGEQTKPAPSVWWNRKADQFSLAKRGERPFALCWEPLFDQSALDAAVRAERLRIAQLIAGQKLKDGKADARRGPGLVGTWHEKSPCGLLVSALAEAITSESQP